MSDIHIKDYSNPGEPNGPTMTRDEATAKYDFIGFAAPFVVVVDRATGQRGTLEFKHAPRVYFNFQPD